MSLMTTDKPKVSVYLDGDILVWFQAYCKRQKRSVSSQIGYMIEQLKEEEEKGN